MVISFPSITSLFLFFMQWSGLKQQRGAYMHTNTHTYMTNKNEIFFFLGQYLPSRHHGDLCSGTGANNKKRKENKAGHMHMELK
jgi:hypothetical protein